VHWRRSRRVAAGCARATAGHAGYWLLSRQQARGDAGAVDGIRAGLREAGFIEGKNFVFEYRWAEKHFDRNPAPATDG
jgi:hypothetical protein